MENVSTMVDSILNALWWPWSRNSNENTNQPYSTTSATSSSLSSSSLSSSSSSSTIASTTSDFVVNNDLRVSSSATSVSSSSSYYIPFGSLFNPFVANDTSTTSTVSNFTEFFTTISSNSSLLAYSNYSTLRPLLNFSAANENDDSSGVSGENLDYYYNFGENATSINHSYIFTTTRTNDTNGSIFLDSAGDESTIYLIQIVVTAIILGIVILATVIGE